VNEEVQKKAMEMLEALAEKLGTTLEHLWEVLLLQAKVEAVEAGLVFLTGASVGLYGLWLVNKARDVKDNDDQAIRWFLGGALALIGLIPAFGNLLKLPTLLINPEYWALREVLRLF